MASATITPISKPRADPCDGRRAAVGTASTTRGEAGSADVLPAAGDGAEVVSTEEYEWAVVFLGRAGDGVADAVGDAVADEWELRRARVGVGVGVAAGRRVGRCDGVARVVVGTPAGRELVARRLFGLIVGRPEVPETLVPPNSQSWTSPTFGWSAVAPSWL
jgi:hypothetical protein